MSTKLQNILEGNVLEFEQKRNRNDGKTIHCFFEGKDDRFFYLDFVRNSFQTYDVFYYICDTKDYVYKTREAIAARSNRPYSMNQLLFFTDRDYDDLINRVRPSKDNIFVTKGYSIEHYLATPEIYKRALAKFFSKVEEDDIAPYLEQFQAAYEAFTQSEILRTISALAILDRRNRKCLKLDEIKMDTFFHINSPNLIVKTYKSQTEINTAITAGEINSSEVGKNYFTQDVITTCIWDGIVRHKKKKTSDSPQDRPLYDLLINLSSNIDEIQGLQKSIKELATSIKEEGQNEITIVNTFLTHIIQIETTSTERNVISEQAQALQEIPFDTYIRGKYLIWFFRTYYEAFRTGLGGTSVVLTKNNELKLLSLLLINLGQTPEDLQLFLASNAAAVNTFHGNT